MFFSISAVVIRFGITKNNKNISNLLKNSVFINLNKRNISLSAKMVDWQTEKERFLKMDKEEKRKFLNSSNRRYQTVENISTWSEYFKNMNHLPQKINILGGYQINPSKNQELANKISIFKGDITTLEVDAIVNAANNSLLGGGGVDGFIHRFAGQELKAECQTLHGCKTGKAKITGGYKLPARYVIHTVGPKGEHPDLLTQCYKNSLQLVLENQLRTVAFPCISTGVYGYPIDRAVHVSNRTVREFLETNGNKVDRIIFCLFGDDDVDIYEKCLQSYFPVE